MSETGKAKVKGGILLEPMITDVDAWFTELDKFADIPFMEEGRKQPDMPVPSHSAKGKRRQA